MHLALHLSLSLFLWSVNFEWSDLDGMLRPPALRFLFPRLAGAVGRALALLAPADADPGPNPPARALSQRTTPTPTPRWRSSPRLRRSPFSQTPTSRPSGGTTPSACAGPPTPRLVRTQHAVAFPVSPQRYTSTLIPAPTYVSTPTPPTPPGMPPMTRPVSSPLAPMSVCAHVADGWWEAEVEREEKEKESCEGAVSILPFLRLVCILHTPRARLGAVCAAVSDSGPTAAAGRGRARGG